MQKHVTAMPGAGGASAFVVRLCRFVSACANLEDASYTDVPDGLSSIMWRRWINDLDSSDHFGSAICQMTVKYSVL